MKWYKRNEPIAPGCSKAFHFNDFVEANDGSVTGLVRGAMNPSSAGDHWFYCVMDAVDGDVIVLFGRALRLIFRIEDDKARDEAIATYYRHKT